MSLNDRLKGMAREVEAEIPVPPELEQRLLAGVREAQTSTSQVNPNAENTSEAINMTTATHATRHRNRLTPWIRWAAAAAIVAVVVAAGALSRPNTALAERVLDGGVNPPAAETLRPTSPADAEKLQSLLPQMVPLHYPDPEHEGFELVSMKQAADAGVYGEMVVNFAGEQVARSTWVVQLHFPKLEPSASMSAGQFFVTKTDQGWVVWFRYH